MTIDEKVDAFVDKLPNDVDGMLYIILYDKVDIAQDLILRIQQKKGNDYCRKLVFTNTMPREEIRQLNSTNIYIFDEFYNYQGNGYN